MIYFLQEDLNGLDIFSLKDLPKTDKILDAPCFEGFIRQVLKAAAVVVLDNIRAVGKHHSYEEILSLVSKEYYSIVSDFPRKVINASGVILHTNLGRAPIDKDIINEAACSASGYSSLEYDTNKGARSDRYTNIARLFNILVGSDDAVIVNNNAAALYLIVNTFAKSNEVIAAKSEMIEIGGRFRVSDMIKSAGGKLKEVGAVNKTYIKDYKEAVSEKSRLMMKISRSNFSLKGFTCEAAHKDIANLAASENIISYFDAGSAFIGESTVGSLNDHSASTYLKYGFDIVSFSADKLLGSIQAGIIAGKKEYIAKLKKNPIMRILRPDKLTLAILHKSLINILKGEKSIFRKISEIKKEEVYSICEDFIKEFESGRFKIIEDKLLFGAGSGDELGVETYSLCLKLNNISANDAADFLRQRERPIIARIQNGAIVICLACVYDKEDIKILKIALKEMVSLDV